MAELLRAALDAGRTALNVERLYFFSGPDAGDAGWTVGPDGAIEPFDPDTRQRDSPRHRAVRARRTAIVNDMADHPIVGDRVRARHHDARGPSLPLLPRGATSP